jgi:hypothetical protein
MNMNWEEVRPHGYRDGTIAEKKSVDILTSILDPRLFKPQLVILDTRPNIDGCIELTMENGDPKAKFDVQVKTLRKNYRTPSFSCDEGFLSYCNNSVTPVLLIAVDHKKLIAFWLHINRELVNSITRKPGQKTYALRFPAENVITKDDNSCHQKWLRIHRELNEIITNANFKQEQLKEAEAKAGLLVKLGIGAPEERNEAFREIHVFLDYYNGLLDHEFEVVKKLFYPDVWKMGIAYAEYGERHSQFCFIPTYWDANGTLIRKYAKSDEIFQHNDDISVTTYYQENPIKKRPQDFALERIEDDIETLIKEKALLLGAHGFAYEQICFFIDRYDFLFNIEPWQDSYSLNEIIKTYREYMPAWITSYARYMNLADGAVIDIDELSRTIDGEKAAEIRKIAGGTRDYYIQSEKIDIAYITRMLDLFEDQQIQRIQRPLIRRFANKERSWIWEAYTPEILKVNLEQFYSVFPSLYNLFIEKYFPMLYTELNYFAEYDKQVIQFSFKHDRFDETGPQIRVFNLKDDESPMKDRGAIVINIDEVLEIFEWKNYDTTSFSEPVNIAGKNYRLVSAWWGGMGFIYGDRPFYTELYALLERRFEKFFKHAIKKIATDEIGVL